jgi:hypothetical protein
VTTAELLIFMLTPQQRHDLISGLLTALDSDLGLLTGQNERWVALIKLLQQEVD